MTTDHTAERLLTFNFLFNRHDTRMHIRTQTEQLHFLVEGLNVYCATCILSLVLSVDVNRFTWQLLMKMF